MGTSTTAKALTVRLRFRVSRVAPRQRGLGNVAGSSRARSNSATPVTRSAHLLGCKRVQWAHAGVEPRCADRAHPLPLDRRRSAALSRGRTAGLSAALPSHIVSAGKTAAYSRSGCNWCDTMTWPIDAATRRPCDAGQSTGTRPSEELGAAPAVQGTALPVRRGARRIHAGQCDGGTACMGQRHPPPSKTLARLRAERRAPHARHVRTYWVLCCEPSLSMVRNRRPAAHDPARRLDASASVGLWR